MVQFLSGFLLSLSLCMDLGIVNIAIMRTGIKHGFAPALWIGIGSTLGDLIYFFLSMAGISFILGFVFVRWGLWVGGTLVLLYFTFNMMREFFHAKQIRLRIEDATEQAGTESEATAKPKAARKYFIQGLSLALSSPSLILWFAAAGGSIIATDVKGMVPFEFVYFFAGFFTACVLWSFFMAYVSWRGGRLMGRTFIQIFYVASALIFLYFAVKVFISGYQTLL